MLSNKDVRIEGRNIIINGEKHPLDPAVEALTKRANIVQGKFSALDTKLDAIEALEKTASGNPISLTGAAEAYVMSNIMTIEPVQSGSGDPSPTNVRPISGLTSGEVETTNGTDTNTASITFGQTVYGGSVNFKTGEVTVTHGFITFDGSEPWYTNGDRGVYLSNNDISPRPKSLGELIFSDYKTIANGDAPSTNGCANFNTSGGAIQIHDENGMTSTAYKTYLSSHNVQLCYELATPVTLTLTPAELELLKGENTISGNGVTINIDYIGR